jgi:hypothetical protein
MSKKVVARGLKRQIVFIFLGFAVVGLAAFVFWANLFSKVQALPKLEEFFL